MFQKGEDIFVIKNREREVSRVFERLVKERIYLTIKITTDVTGVFCSKEGWKEEHGVELLIFE